MNNPTYYSNSEKMGGTLTEVIIGKQRRGKRGTVELRCRYDVAAFYNDEQGSWE